MPEAGGDNIEIAQHLNEPEKRSRVETPRRTEILEIFEAVVLALVAVSTAWSGYQAACWDGQQSLLYGRSSKLRIEVQGMELRGNQIQMYDALTVAEWLKAEAHGDKKLAELFERRLFPEFHPAFEAWKETDPIHNSNCHGSGRSFPQCRGRGSSEIRPGSFRTL